MKAGRICREVKEWVKGYVKPGLGCLEACTKVEEEIVRRGGQWAFPCAIGINHITAHYAPQPDDSDVIRNEDVVKVDLGVEFDGYITDTAITLAFDPRNAALVSATERALQAAIETVRKDPRISEVSKAVSAAAAREGFKPISNLSGHTIGRYEVHAGKSIPSVYMPGLPTLKRDEIFAIEPFLTTKDAAGYVEDGTKVTIFALVARKRTGTKELDDLLDIIWNRRKTLPFTPRWLLDAVGDHAKLMKMLLELERRRVLRGYPTLIESSGKPVAQFEHTMGFDDNGLVVFT